MIDKEWTFEQVMEANERAVENDPELPKRVQPLFVWSALHDLDRYEQRLRSGENFALLLAISKCAQHDIPLPDWTARAYLKKFRSVLNYRVGSWDEAFGRPTKHCRFSPCLLITSIAC